MGDDRARCATDLHYLRPYAHAGPIDITRRAQIVLQTTDSRTVALCLCVCVCVFSVSNRVRRTKCECERVCACTVIGSVEASQSDVRVQPTSEPFSRTATARRAQLSICSGLGIAQSAAYRQIVYYRRPIIPQQHVCVYVCIV